MCTPEQNLYPSDTTCPENKLPKWPPKAQQKSFQLAGALLNDEKKMAKAFSFFFFPIRNTDSRAHTSDAYSSGRAMLPGKPSQILKNWQLTNIINALTHTNIRT